MKRVVIVFSLVSAILVAGLVVAFVQIGAAQTQSITTLPALYHDDEEGATTTVIDEAPVSVSPFGTDDFRFSEGDRLVFSTPLFDREEKGEGRTQLATFYAEATVSAGDTFENLRTLTHFLLVFPNGDQITATGIVGWGNTPGRIEKVAITGGTGAYDGASGTWEHTFGVDTLKLLK